MKKSLIIAYSIVMSLALIFSISYFGVNLFNENKHGELRSELRFEKMSSAILNAKAKSSISDKELIRQIENAVGDTNDFAYVKIIINNKQFYLYPSDYDESQNFTSKYIIDYKKNADGNSTEIKAGLYTLRPSSIYNYAKITFFIILIIALITIILIIINHNLENNKKSMRPIKFKHNKIKDIDEDLAEEMDDTDEIDEPEQTEEADEAEQENDENDFEASEEELSQEEITKEAPAPAEKTEAAELPTQDFTPLELEAVDEEKGLFSPDSGLGWESYLMTRLDNELNRATASELDLSLFIIQIKELERKNPLMKAICQKLINEFQFKDLLFEYKKDCVCALKISMNIDSAVSFAEELIKKIKETDDAANLEVYIGISSRGIRMVSGERLLKEADEALLHAQEDKNNPLVGFRADAVKYRKFLETK